MRACCGAFNTFNRLNTESLSFGRTVDSHARLAFSMPIGSAIFELREGPVAGELYAAAGEAGRLTAIECQGAICDAVAKSPNATVEIEFRADAVRVGDVDSATVRTDSLGRFAIQVDKRAFCEAVDLPGELVTLHVGSGGMVGISQRGMVQRMAMIRCVAVAKAAPKGNGAVVSGELRMPAKDAARMARVERNLKAMAEAIQAQGELFAEMVRRGRKPRQVRR